MQSLHNQRIIIVSYIYNNIDSLENKYFDYAYKKLIAEYNKRLKIDKELNKTLIEEYGLLDIFDIEILNTKPVIHKIAKNIYLQHKRECIVKNKLASESKIGLKLNRNIAIYYESVILNAYLYLSIKKPLKLNIELFTGIRKNIAKLINKLVDKDLLYRASDYIDKWALNLDKTIQDEVVELYATETVSNINYYYNKLKIRG